MHEELDSHRLPRIRAHVHRLVDPGVVVGTLMEDRLQDGAVAIGDVSILPVERDTVSRAGVVPEAQCGASRHRPELLIEGAVSKRLAPATTIWLRYDAQRDRGKRPSVREGVSD